MHQYKLQTAINLQICFQRACVYNTADTIAIKYIIINLDKTVEFQYAVIESSATKL